MTIYAGNLSLEVTEEDLRQKFGAFGAVTPVAEDQATSVEESEKKDTKSVELPAMFSEHTTLIFTKEP